MQIADPSKSRREKGAIQRYLIKKVYNSRYITSQGQKQDEKVSFHLEHLDRTHRLIQSQWLYVRDEDSNKDRSFTLRQSWLDTRCTEGAYVHLIGERHEKGQYIIDDSHGLLILHPDHLISALVVADSFGCLRRAVLQDRVKATSEASPPQVYGIILHEIFQEAMMANRWDTPWLRATIQTIVERHIEDLYAIQLNVDQAMEHLESKVGSLQAWAKVFVQAKPGVCACESFSTMSNVLTSNTG